MGGIGKHKIMIQLLKPGTLETRTGLEVIWTPARQILAEIKKDSTADAEQSGANRAGRTIIFNTREYLPISSGDRLGYAGQTFEITGINRGEMRHPQDVEITAVSNV